MMLKTDNVARLQRVSFRQLLRAPWCLEQNTIGPNIEKRRGVIIIIGLPYFKNYVQFTFPLVISYHADNTCFCVPIFLYFWFR